MLVNAVMCPLNGNPNFTHSASAAGLKFLIHVSEDRKKWKIVNNSDNDMKGWVSFFIYRGE